MNIGNILKKYRDEYDRKFEAYTINCYLGFVFVNSQIFNVKLKRMISLVRLTFIRQKLLKKFTLLKKMKRVISVLSYQR